MKFIGTILTLTTVFSIGSYTAEVIPQEKFLPLELNFISDNSLKEWKPPELFQKEFVYYLSGHDDDGRPIWIAEFGKWNLKKLLEGGDEIIKEFDIFVNQMVYNVLDSLKLSQSKEEDDSKGQIVVIVDMEGYSLAQLTNIPNIKYMLRKITELQPIASKRIEVGYVINVNFLAQSFINLIRPVLGEVMQKVEIYGTQKTVWLPRLLKHLPKDQLPEWYGGLSSFKPSQVFG